MKLYFLQGGGRMVAEISDQQNEPDHVAAFDLADGQSRFAPRYELRDGALVDLYPGQTDEQVAAAILAAEETKAAELAAQNAQH